MLTNLFFHYYLHKGLLVTNCHVLLSGKVDVSRILSPPIRRAMSTSRTSWLKLILLFLALIILIFFSAGGSKGIESPDQVNGIGFIFALYLLLWLGIGALLSSMSSMERSVKFSETFWRILFVLLGWGILWLIWYLPIRFPNLKLNDYGFQFDLHKSPAAFWVTVAFILGFYEKLVPKIPVAVWNGIKASLSRTSGLDLQGSEPYRIADVWKGLKSMFKDLFKRA
jgi:hypothetical protein